LKKSPRPPGCLCHTHLAAGFANNQGLDVFAGRAFPAATMAALAPASAQVPAG
jgi:hypothetical protein